MYGAHWYGAQWYGAEAPQTSSMSILTFSLIILSALLHSIWNLAAKTKHSIYAFSFSTALGETLLWSPLIFYIIFYTPEYSPATWSQEAWIWGIVSAFIHTIYYVVLLHGYSVAPLSVVYPVARGSGSLLSALLAVSFFGEHISPLAVCGIVLIVLGIWFLPPRSQHQESRTETLRGTWWGLLIGASIAAYTMVDAHSVKHLGTFPFTFDYMTCVLRVFMMLPLMKFHEITLAESWTKDRKPILVVAILSSVSYIMLLTAVQMAPLSRVAPAREISMLFGTFFGGSILKEGHMTRRMCGAAMIAVGVILLTGS